MHSSSYWSKCFFPTCFLKYTFSKAGKNGTNILIRKPILHLHNVIEENTQFFSGGKYILIDKRIN